jgi:peptidoglycan/xylan/chitin deacetylase (PgdA/CDA1 family)
MNGGGTMNGRRFLPMMLAIMMMFAVGCSDQSVESIQPVETGKEAGDKDGADQQDGSEAGNVKDGDKQADNQPGGKESDTKGTGGKVDGTSDAVGDNESQVQPVAAKYRINKIYDVAPLEGSTEEKLLLLTFDDGPKEKEMLTNMLNILDKHEVKAIFFVNGYRVKQNPELLQLIYDRGQTIGNHAWDHINLKKLSVEKIDKQIGDVQKIVKEVVGVEPRFFRPPFGASNEIVKERVSYYGMTYMNWSVGSKDWEKGFNQPDKVEKQVLDTVRAGGNILMHELPWTMEALDPLLTKLKAEGYSFVNPELIE